MWGRLAATKIKLQYQIAMPNQDFSKCIIIYLVTPTIKRQQNEDAIKRILEIEQERYGSLLY